MAEMNLLKSLFFVGTQTILAKLNMLLAKTNKRVLYNTETSFLINYQSLNINIKTISIFITTVDGVDGRNHTHQLKYIKPVKKKLGYLPYQQV